MSVVFGNYVYVFGGVNATGSVVEEIERLPLNVVTAVTDKPAEKVTSLDLMGNYPNPFNPSTVIKYKVPFTQKVSVRIYDMTGRELLLLDEGVKSPGQHEVVFDAASVNSGSSLSSGVYFYRLTGENVVKTGKMILIK